MHLPRRLLVAVLCTLQCGLAAGALGADVQARLDQINEREKQLIEKLDAVRQREHYLEAQLEQVRQRKQALLSKESGRPVQAPGAAPSAVPATATAVH